MSVVVDVDEGKSNGASVTVDATETIKAHEVTIGEGTITPIIKRLFFDRSNKGQEMAKTQDCEELLHFWSKTHSKWVISDRDIAGRLWVELVFSGSCVFAVGHPANGNHGDPVKDQESSLGNLDIVGILTQSITGYGKGGEIEARGVIQCSAFDLVFRVVGKGSFDCCRDDKPPGKSMGKTWVAISNGNV
ncbi:hypothetical protein LZ32DRAFT_680280 [Colletotrichum eremochloae]|nr:hypothetical protein LZ32DRAFT_680280 [Colletotrichum eremochloae]